jgi:hypothetical protein
MANVKLVWNDAAFIAAITAGMVDRLDEAGKELRDQLVANISQTHSPPTSDPGEYPHMDSEELAKTIFWDLQAERLRGIVGSPQDYALDLEYGTHRTGARPFFRMTFEEMIGRLKQVMTKPMRLS